MLTLKDSLKIMKKINSSKNYNCFFSNGKMCIESKLIEILPNNYKGDYN